MAESFMGETTQTTAMRIRRKHGACAGLYEQQTILAHRRNCVAHVNVKDDVFHVIIAFALVEHG